MRLRLGLLLAAVLATLLSPITPQAHAFGGYATAPLNVSAVAIAGGIRVSWSVPADVDTGITGYRVETSTTGTSGTWSLSTTTSSSTYTYDVLGLSQVATYVRVAATTAAGIGTYGYPWTKIYETINKSRASGDNSFTYVSGYGTGGSDSATTLSNAGAQFTRIRYQMTASVNYTATLGAGLTTDTATADFYKWTAGTNTTSLTVAPTFSNLQFPVIPLSGSGIIVQANVTDLNVWSTSSNVTKKKGANGRLEIWPWDYTVGLSGLTNYAAGDNLTYDFDDTVFGGATPSGSYGSFQVHNLDDGQVVFAWNSHGSNVTPDIGFGNKTDRGQKDSTFCHDNNTTNGYCQEVANFRMQVFVNLAVTPLADATPPTVSRIDSRFYVKNADTITVRSSEVGTVYLVSQVVNVTNLASITAASTNNKNSATVSSANADTTMTIGYQSDGLYNLYAADSAGNLSTAILATVRIDNTAPTASSIVVNSTGTAILLTANETITNSAQIFTYYTVSDSGSAISVTATSFSGSVATLTLSRAIPAGATVYFQYNMGAGLPAGKWIDLTGNEIASIWNRTITNNSAVPISVTLTVPDPISKGVPITASAAVNVAGKVTFTLAGKRIPGCLSKVASGTTPITVTCTFKPALSARQTIAAILVPTLSAYPNTVATVDRFILKRTTLR